MGRFKEALADTIVEAIDSDFWCEDSMLVDAYADENNGEQLKCDMRSAYRNDGMYNDDNMTVVVDIGDRSYLIRVSEMHHKA